MSGRLSSRYRVGVVPPDLVFFLADEDARCVRGESWANLAPHLAAPHAAGLDVSRLAAAAGLLPAEVEAALAALAAQGLLATSDEVPMPDRPPAVADCGAALAAVRVVAVGDYLDPRAAALAAGVPPGTAWLPVKAGGASVWLGPLFGAGGLACPACLRLALARSRPVAALYYHLCAEPVAPRAPAPARSAWVAEEIARRLADGSLLDTLWVLDPATGEGVAHRARREVECPACGTGGLLPRPPPLDSRRPVHPVDGGYRVESPAATRRRLEGLVDPLTGSVREVRRFDPGAPDAPCVAVATYPHPLPPATWAQLRARPRVTAAGKGTSADQAVVGAMAEAIERASGVFRGDEPRRTASFEELGDEAIPPPALLLYSRRQLERGAGPGPQWSPRARTEWSPVTALAGGSRRWMPTGLAYYAYAPPAGAWGRAADSNGCAAGSTWEEAVLQGLLELVERDAVATWWYNGLSRPRLDDRLDGALGRHAAAVRDLCRRHGSELFLLDLTGDLALPVVAALALPAAGTGSLRLGFGAHLEAPLAAARALSELAQFLPLADGTVAVDRRAAAHVPPWLATACRAAPATALPRGRPCSEFSAALGHVRSRLAAAGLEAWVLDQTRDPDALRVVRVVVPGLRPWTRRLAPGRLYDVPVAMGWLAAARTEAEMETLPLYS